MKRLAFLKHGLSGSFRRYVSAAILVAVVCLAWGPGFTAPMQYDDYRTPGNDPASQSLIAFSHDLPKTLRPLTKLTFATESSLGLVEPSSRRVLSIILFGALGIVLQALLLNGGLSLPLATGLAGVFLAHPVHCETILALAGRSALLSLVLVLLSFLFRQQGRVWGSILCAALAVLARETSLIWLLYVIYNALKGASNSKVRIRILCAGLLPIGVIALSSTFWALGRYSFVETDVLNRLSMQLAALSRGTWMLFAEPGAFSVNTDFDPRGFERLMWILLSVALYVGAGINLWRSRMGSLRRELAALWLALVLPLHSVVPKLDPLTARGFSGLFVPIALLLGWGLAELLRRASRRPAWAWGAFVTLAILACGLLSLSRPLAKAYQDPIALWTDAAQKSPKATRPWVNLGVLLAQKRRYVEALDALQQAQKRAPFDSNVQFKIDAVHTLLENEQLMRR